MEWHKTLNSLYGHDGIFDDNANKDMGMCLSQQARPGCLSMISFQHRPLPVFFLSSTAQWFKIRGNGRRWWLPSLLLLLSLARKRKLQRATRPDTRSMELMVLLMETPGLRMKKFTKVPGDLSSRVCAFNAHTLIYLSPHQAIRKIEICSIQKWAEIDMNWRLGISRPD